jgi:DNA-binding NarL/FixJ family response regulator
MNGSDMTIRLLLVEDHAAVRDSLAFLLDNEPDMTVSGAVGTLSEARCHLSGIDIALLDLDLPDGIGTDLIAPMRVASPAARALVLTGSREPQSRAQAVEAGASGVLHKTAAIPEVIETIRKLAAGEPLLPPEELITLLQLAARQRQRNDDTASRISQLTPRERDLLWALAEGLSDQQISDRHSVSIRTIQTQMTRLLDKLDVHSRLQALVLAVRHGAVRID